MAAVASPSINGSRVGTSGRSASPTATLDGLLALRPSELEPMYVNAKVPRLDEVGGDLRGRMLAWPVLTQGSALANFFRAFASAKSFPWKGKSFTPDEHRGEGINRVFTDRFRLFRFETFIGKSRAGDFDALQLNYDLPENPFFIRMIKDEIREIEPGVWLGQAWLKTKKSETLVLYFGLANPR
jgi:hypothetical protein